jgi:hypothetical protein
MIHFRYLLLSFACVFFPKLHAHAQSAQSAQFNPYKDLQFFIPVGYSVLDRASGDLNRDSFPDLVLILKNDSESMNYDTTRPLLLLAGDGKGKYRLLARNDHVVLCLGCGGAMGDPYDGITIKRGYFSIEHMGGGNWRWTRIITFRYDAVSGHFILHRDAGSSWYTGDNDHQMTDNVDNKEDFDKLPFEQFTSDKIWQEK